MNSKKIITIFLVFMMLSSIIVYDAPKSEAISGGDVVKILGGGVGAVAACTGYAQVQGIVPELPSLSNLLGGTTVPVDDSGAKFQQDVINCLEFVKGFAVTQLRKRLLDSLVNETIKWVQGGGDPKFVTNVGGFFDDAAQAAVGDTLQEIGAGELCYNLEPFRLRAQVNLQRADFFDQVSCTLDDVVESITEFRGDFRNGGWLAYQELLMPQNNALGVQILAESELIRRTVKRQREAEFESSVGNGFLSNKVCRVWERVAFKGSEFEANLRRFEGDGSSADQAFDLRLTSPDNKPYNGKSPNPAGSVWRCAESETVTPGKVISESITKAVGSDIDFLVSAEDLSGYTAALVDAIVGRLTKEAATGLSGLFRGSESPERNEITQGELPQAEGNTASDNNLNLDRANTNALDIINSTLDRLESVEADLDTASSRNSNLLASLRDLRDCQDSKNIVLNNDLENDIKNNDDRTSQISSLKNAVVTEERGAKSLLQETRNSSVNEESIGAIDTYINIAEDLNKLVNAVNNLESESLSLLSTINVLLDQTESDLETCRTM